ncbi:MAG: hypothetical protein SGPRY_013127, partial [Prymnesium sp.]
MSGALAPPAPPARTAEASGLSSMLSSWLSPSRPHAAPQPTSADRAILLQAGSNASFPAGVELLCARPLDEAEVAGLEKLFLSGEPTRWNSSWASTPRVGPTEWWRCNTSEAGVEVGEEPIVSNASDPSSSDPTLGWGGDVVAEPCTLEADAVLAQIASRREALLAMREASKQLSEEKRKSAKPAAKRKPKQTSAHKIEIAVEEEPSSEGPPVGLLLRVRWPRERSSWSPSAGWLLSGGSEIRKLWNSVGGEEPVVEGPPSEEWGEVTSEVKSFMLRTTNSSFAFVQSWSSQLSAGTTRLFARSDPSEDRTLEGLRALARQETGKRLSQQQVRSRLSGLRAEQLLALAMAREHQMLQLVRLAAAVSRTDPELASSLPLDNLRLLLLAEREAPVERGPFSGEVSSARDLVPYRPPLLARHGADYASFLFDELQRLLSEGWGESLAPVDLREEFVEEERRRIAEEERRARAEERRKIVEEDKAKAAAELSEMGHSFQEDLQTALFDKRSADEQSGLTLDVTTSKHRKRALAREEAVEEHAGTIFIEELAKEAEEGETEGEGDAEDEDEGEEEGQAANEATSQVSAQLRSRLSSLWGAKTSSAEEELVLSPQPKREMPRERTSPRPAVKKSKAQPLEQPASVSQLWRQAFGSQAFTSERA